MWDDENLRDGIRDEITTNWDKFHFESGIRDETATYNFGMG